MHDAQVPVGPMGLDDLRQAVVRAAQQAGLIVESALLASLTAHAYGQAGVLPLLSHASLSNITAAKVKLAVRHCQDDEGLTPDSEATLDGEVTTAGNVLWGASLNHSGPRVEEGSPALYRFKAETDLETCLGWITPFRFHSKIDFYASYVVNASTAEADAVSRNSDWEVERTGPF
ncbi:hypothetical protein ACIP79_12645 [Streptomyces sp. NPDC088747]|uniref:nSTAND1 domain-containing NTPase n=1 Tax=Streptomyces sp. NPDC088747 TaxID=3365886 RepID=UPI0037FCC294